MTNGEQQLRKANKELDDEVAELKVKLEKDLFNLNIAFDTNQTDNDALMNQYKKPIFFSTSA